MWILEFLPNWLFYLLLFAGIVGYILSNTLLKLLPYSSIANIVSVLTTIFAIFMVGAVHNNDAWVQRSQQLQQKVLELETKSAEANTKIVEKVLVKKQTIKEHGDEIVKYIDREVVKDNEVIKYIEHCPKLPTEIINTINKAAKP
jgi:predicted PurR-regulated permease PerM